MTKQAQEKLAQKKPAKRQVGRTERIGPKPVRDPVNDSQPVDRVEGARAIRRARARKLVLRLALWVVLPTALASVYYGCLAAAQYESVSVIAVQSERAHVGLETLAAIIPSSSHGRDSAFVVEYIRSRDMLEVLVEEHGFAKHYQDDGADWLTRLDSDASSEEVYEYYRERVTIGNSSASGALELRVRAYSGEAAQKFARSIIASAEEMVNQMSERARLDQIRIAEEEVSRAERRLAKARDELLALQGEGHDFNPEVSATAVMSVRTQLEVELAKVKAELSQLESVMRSDAPKVIALRQRARSLQTQINRQNRRLVAGTSDDSDNDSINESIARFEPALLQKELAEQAYAAALRSLEIARAESLSERRYLVTIAKPSIPTAPTHPKRGWGIATAFVVSLALMIIVTMLGAAIREHAKF